MPRPPADDPRNIIVSVRLTRAEKHRLKSKADKRSLSDYIRLRLFGE